jgi:hypothetical protein
MVLALIGVAMGLAGSFAATPLLADFLYGIKAHDVMTLALVSSILVAVTFLASYIPARHAPGQIPCGPFDTNSLAIERNVCQTRADVP